MLFVRRNERTIVRYRNVCVCVHFQQNPNTHMDTHTQLLKASLCLWRLRNDSMTACQTSYEIDSTQPELPSPFSTPLSVSLDDSTLDQPLLSVL